MKKYFAIIFLLSNVSGLCSEMQLPSSENDMVVVYEVEEMQYSQEESISATEQDEHIDESLSETDSFDDLINDPIPSGIVHQPKPVSSLEAFMRDIGCRLLMKYIVLKIWLRHCWQSLWGVAQHA